MNEVVCNPMNLSYAFQEVKNSGKYRVAREAADPTRIRFKNRFYLFPSVSGGFWHSDDLADWTFVETPDWPIYDYAPDVQEIDGALYFTASGFQKGAIYRTADPVNEPLKEVARPLKIWGPNIFQDDDGRVYIYWGCSNKKPIYGMEIDRKTLMPVGKHKELIFGNPKEHGWERIGVNNNPNVFENGKDRVIRLLMGTNPYIEGPYMTKHDEKYYLQYAAPGTELAGYGNGVYVGDSALGPFVYQSSNPFSHKPGGFIKAAGHGSTLQDKYGNWWHIASMQVSNRFGLERRLGLFPAGFDNDGILFCNQNFADYPMNVPSGKVDPWNDTFTGWMLLSYKKKVTASSESVPGSKQRLTDESIRTYWTAATNKPGEWAQIDLGAVKDVRAVQLNFYEEDGISVERTKDDMHGNFPKRHITVNAGPLRYLLEGSADGENWEVLEDKRNTSGDLPHDFLCFKDGKQLRHIRVTGEKMLYNGRLCMSGIRVFGHGIGERPAEAKGKAVRNGPVSVKLSWNRAEGADGYNIRYGNHPNKLYHSWMVYDDTEFQMNCLNEGQKYYFAIDSFNENGITPGEVITAK